jgi:hypothetical protein
MRLLVAVCAISYSGLSRDEHRKVHVV